MSSDSNNPITPTVIIPASPMPPAPVMQLPDFQYAEAAPIIETPVVVAKPARKLPSFGCGKYAIILLVVVVVIAVLILVLFSGLPTGPSLPRNTVSQPVISSVVSKPTDKPVETPKITEIAFAGIGKDGTIRIYDAATKDLIISLQDKNWSNIQLSPQGDFLSVLSASAKDSSDQNLQIYNVKTGAWKVATVFDKTTKGIDGYFWIDDTTIAFTQAGWIHTYNNRSSEIVKLVKLDQKLVAINRTAKQLMLQNTVSRIATPAVTRQIPDPNYKGRETPPIITVEDKPAILKYDNIFTVTDFAGEVIFGARVDDIVDLSGNYVLNKLFFAPISGVYLAELVGYEPVTGATTREMLKVFMLSGDLKQEIKITSPAKINILGPYQADKFLFNVFDNSFALISLGNVNFAQNQISDSAFPSATSLEQKVDEIVIVEGYHQNDWMIRIATTEQIKGLPVKQLGWWKLNQGLQQLEKVRIGVDFVELINYSKSQNPR